MRKTEAQALTWPHYLTKEEMQVSFCVMNKI